MNNQSQNTDLFDKDSEFSGLLPIDHKRGEGASMALAVRLICTACIAVLAECRQQRYRRVQQFSMRGLPNFVAAPR